MKSLYESILSKTGTGAEQSIRKWIDSLNSHDVPYEVKPVKGGFYVIFDSFEKQPHLGNFHITKQWAHNFPKLLLGVFYVKYASKDKPECLVPFEFHFSNTSFSKFEIPHFDYTQDDRIKLQSFAKPLEFGYSNADEMVGSFEMKGNMIYDVKLHQSYIHKLLSLDLPGVSTIYLNDGTFINAHNIKGCRVRKLVIGDVVLSHTAAVDRNSLGFDPYDDGKGGNATLFIRHGRYYKTNPWLTSILQELEKNNKIEKLEYLGDMIGSRRGESVYLVWFPKENCYIAK